MEEYIKKQVVLTEHGFLTGDILVEFLKQLIKVSRLEHGEESLMLVYASTKTYSDAVLSVPDSPNFCSG